MENIFKKFIYTERDEIYNSTKYKFLKNKEILITGATGLLGQYFVAFFLKASEGKNKPKNITLLHKSEIPEYLNFLKKNKSFKLRKINLAEKKFSSTKKYDYIIHLATYGQPKKFLDESLKTFFLNTSLIKDLIFLIKKKELSYFLAPVKFISD